MKAILLKANLLFVLFLCFAVLPASAQWAKLGTDEDSLIARIGKPVRSDARFDYFRNTYFGIKGWLIIETNPAKNIEQIRWYSDSVSDSVRDLLYKSFESIGDSIPRTRLTACGSVGRFGMWLTRDSIVSLIKYDNGVDFTKLLRSYYYCTIIDSEPIQDSFFTVSESALPLDSEATRVAKAWKRFLELPPWDAGKFTLWSRSDLLAGLYWGIPQCPDYSSEGYRAKLVGIEYDPQFRCYILSTVFSPMDSANGLFSSSWKKTSRQITYFVNEDGNWKITTALRFVTSDWKLKRYDSIQYHFPSTHTFNEGKAHIAQHFVDSISTIFGIPSPHRIDYYYAFRSDNVYSPLGLDVAVWPRGILLDGKSIIVTYDTNENFTHELVHAALSSLSRPSVIAEGIAEFIGGDTSSNNIFIRTAGEILQDSGNIKLSEVWRTNTLDNSTAAYLPYAAGLIFFQKIAEHGGMKDVVAFYKASTSLPEFEKAVKRYLNIDPANIDSYWRSELEKAYRTLNPGDTK